MAVREKLPEAPKEYSKSDQDRMRKLVERAIAQPPAPGTILITQIEPQLIQTIITAGKLVRKVQIRTTGTIALGDTETGVIDIQTPSTILMLLTVDTASWVRFYDSQASLDNDSGRVRTVDPVAGEGCVGEFIITEDLAGVEIHVAPVMFLYNGEDPVGTVIHYAITNDDGASAAISLDMTIVEVETATS